MSEIDFTRATTPTNTKLPKMRLMTDEKFTFTQKTVKKSCIRLPRSASSKHLSYYKEVCWIMPSILMILCEVKRQDDYSTGYDSLIFN